MPDNPQSPIARRRFALLSVARAAGVLMMLGGMVLWFGRGDPQTNLIGSALFFAGFLASLVLPAVLLRRWQTPPR